jgi:hypothetical protein
LNGSLEIDINAVERPLYAVLLDRKIHLFLGPNSGGQWAALLYSFIATAKRNGLDPPFYPRIVLARSPEHPISPIEELPPWNIAAPVQSISSWLFNDSQLRVHLR